MNKKLLWLIPFITALLVLTSCEFLNKKSTEKAVASKRKIASVNPYPNHSKNQPVSNKVASAVVLVKDKKPICTLSTAKAPHLVPKPLKVDPRRNTLNLKLPQCRQQEASMIRSTIGEAIVLDKYGGYKTAGPPIALATVTWCLIGTSLNLAISDHEFRKNNEKTVKKTMKWIGTVFAGVTVAGDFMKSSYLKSLGITGLCYTGTTFALYLFEKE